MATVTTTWREVIPADAATVLRAIQAAAVTKGCKLNHLETWLVEVRRGSQARLRTMGFWAKPQHMPMRATVELSTIEMGTLVEIKVVDTFGFGLPLGLEHKLERSAEELLALLAEAARSVVKV